GSTRTIQAPGAIGGKRIATLSTDQRTAFGITARRPSRASEGAMADDVLKFGDYGEAQNDEDSLIRCARCGEKIPAISTRCPECGVHFQGEAQDFFHPTDP